MLYLLVLLASLPASIKSDLCELEKGLDKIDLNKLRYIAATLRDYGIDMISLLSDEERAILVKRGCEFIAPFEDGLERIYTADLVKWYYEQLHYDKEIISDEMKLDGATPEEIESEFEKSDTFLRTDTTYGDPYPEFTDEQYQIAVTYLEVEKFVELLQQEVTMNLTEKIDAISNLVAYTLSVSALKGESLEISKEESQNVSDKVLAIINKTK